MAVQHTPTPWLVVSTYQNGETNYYLKNTKRMECEPERRANRKLIEDAVNNTAGKGIDPNAVPGLLQALEEARRVLILCGLIDKSGQADNAVKVVEHAIEKAKLS